MISIFKLRLNNNCRSCGIYSTTPAAIFWNSSSKKLLEALYLYLINFLLNYFSFHRKKYKDIISPEKISLYLAD